MVSIAYAMGQGGAAAQGGQGGFATLVPLILMFVIFYFLLIRPQQKKQKEHTQMLGVLKKGDLIITGGGILGKITSADEEILTVEVADKVRIKISRGSVAALRQEGQAPKASKKNDLKSK